MELPCFLARMLLQLLHAVCISKEFHGRKRTVQFFVSEPIL